MNKKNGKRILEANNLKTGEYFPNKKINLQIADKVNIIELISRNDKNLLLSNAGTLSKNVTAFQKARVQPCSKQET